MNAFNSLCVHVSHSFQPACSYHGIINLVRTHERGNGSREGVDASKYVRKIRPFLHAFCIIFIRRIFFDTLFSVAATLITVL